LYSSKIIGFLLFLPGLLALINCQGVSAGPAIQQQQSGALTISNAVLNFGSVTAGRSKTLTATATNSGTASVTINSVAISTKYFSLTAPTLPISLAVGQSTPITVGFTPNAAGTFNATVSITSTASDSVTNLSLSGTGISTAGQLSLTPTSDDLGSVTVGSKQSATVTLNNVGQSDVNISQISIIGTGFQISGIASSLTLNAGQSTTFTVAFAPQAAGNSIGTVTITSDASNPTLSMPLSGTGLAAGALASNPSSLSFGNVQVGNKGTRSETVTNTSGSSVTISQIAASGSGFSLGGITAPVTLASGQGATFSVNFSPTTAASASGQVTITSNAPNSTLTIPLSGTGTATATAQLGVNPSSLGIGNVIVGTSGNASGSLTANGASVTLTGASSSNTAFVVGGISLPVTIQAGQSLPFTVTFSPLVTGTASSTLTFSSNAQPSTTTESLTGNGTPAPTHSVNLSWNASTSSGVTGYNIYRAVYAGSCGSLSKINSVLNTGTLYTDSTVADGMSYCYAATTVNSSNDESGYSNIVTNIKIPAP
jgi:Protein of unknown function (DUF1573)/Abnormal spindle-like microcephaly-assoc'd, ASPM-SPD-2-Hydin